MTQPMAKISIYVPKKYIQQRPIEKLKAIADREDRSVNYMVIQAILEYVKKHS